MSDKREAATTGRRDFLKLAGLGTMIGGAALVAGGKPAEAAAPVAGTGSGYRETEHVRTYYKSARF